MEVKSDRPAFGNRLEQQDEYEMSARETSNKALRMDKIRLVRSRIDSGYYDNSEIDRKVARIIVDLLRG